MIFIQRHHFTHAFHLAFGIHIFFWQNLHQRIFCEIFGVNRMKGKLRRRPHHQSALVIFERYLAARESVATIVFQRSSRPPEQINTRYLANIPDTLQALRSYFLSAGYCPRIGLWPARFARRTHRFFVGPQPDRRSNVPRTLSCSMMR